MINLTIPAYEEHLRPRITVIGVGGAGGNAVNNMIRTQLEGCEFVVANTDAQALNGSESERRIQLGVGITQGLGAGARPDIGRAAAEEAIDEIATCMEGSHMAFITAGMGGGTGTGAAPVIARAAREQGILTVGVITKPFHFEGAHRMRIAEAGLQELQQYVDTLIVIPNQNLFRVANEKTTFADAFRMADEVLASGVRGVTDLMVMPGLINLDFADIRTVMAEMGKAMMGTGEAEGDRRSINAAEAAISNPLLDDVSMKGARGVLVNITGGLDMTLYEVDEAVNRIREEVDQDANIIFGSTFDDKLEGRVRVSVVATGIEVEAEAGNRPSISSLSLVSTKQARPAEDHGQQQAGNARGQAFPQPVQRQAPQRPQVAPRPAAPQPGRQQPAVEAAQPARARIDTTPARPEPQQVGHAQATAGARSAPARPAAPRPAPEPVAEDDQEELSLHDYLEDLDEAEEQYAEAEPEYVEQPAERPAPRAVTQTAAPAHAPVHETAGDAGQRKAFGGLFRRVTGLIKEEQPTAQHRQQRVAPAQPATPRPQPAPQPAAPATQQATARAQRPLQTAARPPLPRNEDEGLDIPAFLRRQAN
ncbi:MAG: cell division protein FtsZ [Azospirillaceae bacterium]